MFASIISKAATVDVFCNGTEGANSWDGAVQLVSYLDSVILTILSFYFGFYTYMLLGLYSEAELEFLLRKEIQPKMNTTDKWTN